MECCPKPWIDKKETGEYEKEILHCIVYYNSSRVVDFPFTEEMLADGVKPNSSSIFAWGKKQMGANFITVAPQKLIQTPYTVVQTL